jgi:hypothetical protein
VGPRAGLDPVVKRKIPSPCRESNLQSFSAVPLSYRDSCDKVIAIFADLIFGIKLMVWLPVHNENIGLCATYTSLKMM